MTAQRPVTLPSLSVVVAGRDMAAVVAACLDALQDQIDAPAFEIIVAEGSTDATPDIVRTRFPAVRLLHFDEPLNLPQLRARGLLAARGDVIALLDPYSIADARWAAHLLESHASRPHPAIGGAVEIYRPESQSLTGWAQYIYEYGGFTPPLPEGAVRVIPGSNMSYKRGALPLDEPERLMAEGFWKTFVNSRLESTTEALWQTPRAIVRLWKPIAFGEFLRSRYDHGRCFAGMRVARASRAARLGRALSTPMLPGVFLWRLIRDFWPKRRYRGQFVRALPLIALLFAHWAWGELWGYVLGPGRTCRRLRY